MSARDITGGVAANYVLPATSGTPGQVLAVGPPVVGLNQLVWATAAPKLVTAYTLTVFEPGGDGSTSAISGNLYRTGTTMILAMQGVAATMVTVVASGPITAQVALPAPDLPASLATLALPIFDILLGVNIVAIATLDATGFINIGPNAGALWPPGKKLALLGFTLTWEAAA